MEKLLVMEGRSGRVWPEAARAVADSRAHGRRAVVYVPEQMTLQTERALIEDLSLKGLLRLSGLSRTTPIIPGGIVCTSGVGGVYPKGIRVGSVTEVMTSSGSGVNAIVSPSVDFQHLEEIMVITGSGTEG